MPMDDSMVGRRARWGAIWPLFLVSLAGAGCSSATDEPQPAPHSQPDAKDASVTSTPDSAMNVPPVDEPPPVVHGDASVTPVTEDGAPPTHEAAPIPNPAHDASVVAEAEAGVAVRTGDAGSPSTGSCPPQALFCDDFEHGNFDGWTKLESGGTLSLDTTHAVSGKAALGVSIPSNQAGGFLERKGAPLFPLPNGKMFGRMMIYFDSLPDGHTDLVRGAASGGGTPWYDVGEQHGAVMLNYYNGGASDCWARPSPSKPIPTKQWMCWEWSFDGPNNEMVFYVDGQLNRKVSGVGDGCLQNSGQTWKAPTFASLRVGAYIAERGPAATKIWIDDVAVGVTERLGCPSAAPAP